jgi:hypothetical protein
MGGEAASLGGCEEGLSRKRQKTNLPLAVALDHDIVFVVHRDQGLNFAA